MSKEPTCAMCDHCSIGGVVPPLEYSNKFGLHMPAKFKNDNT